MVMGIYFSNQSQVLLDFVIEFSRGMHKYIITFVYSDLLNILAFLRSMIALKYHKESWLKNYII